MPRAPASAPSPSPSPLPTPSRSRSSRKLPRPGTFSHAGLPRTPSVPRGRSYHGKPLSAAAQAAQQGYFARKAAKMYAERKKAAATGSATAIAPADSQPIAEPDMTGALKPANHNENPVEVINITVDAEGVKIDENKPRVSAMGSRTNSRARMTRSSSRQRNLHPRADDKENLITDARLDAHIEAYFNRKRVAVVGAPITQPTDTRPDDQSTTSNHSWDGSMPKRRNSRSVIQRDHAISQRVSPSLNAKPSSTALSPRQAMLSPATLGQACNLKVSTNDNVNDQMSAPFDQAQDGTHTSADVANEETSDASCNSQLPNNGKWCDECAGVGLHISALLSELQTQRPVPEAGAADAGASSGSGAKKGWKSMVTQTVLGESKSKSSEKAKLQQEINVLRATVDFLYKKIERLETTDSTSATSASSR
ncbi:unnamed protein product [Agarophyton chilense]